MRACRITDNVVRNLVVIVTTNIARGMGLYRVFSEPQLIKHYSTIFSRATLFQLIIYAVVIVAPFFVAYATNGKAKLATIVNSI